MLRYNIFKLQTISEGLVKVHDKRIIYNHLLKMYHRTMGVLNAYGESGAAAKTIRKDLAWQLRQAKNDYKYAQRDYADCIKFFEKLDKLTIIRK